MNCRAVAAYGSTKADGADADEGSGDALLDWHAAIGVETGDDGICRAVASGELEDFVKCADEKSAKG